MTGFCGRASEASGSFHKVRAKSRSSYEILASQEGLCFMQLVIWLVSQLVS